MWVYKDKLYIQGLIICKVKIIKNSEAEWDEIARETAGR